MRRADASAADGKARARDEARHSTAGHTVGDCAPAAQAPAASQPAVDLHSPSANGGVVSATVDADLAAAMAPAPPASPAALLPRREVQPAAPPLVKPGGRKSGKPKKPIKGGHDLAFQSTVDDLDQERADETARAARAAAPPAPAPPAPRPVPRTASKLLGASRLVDDRPPPRAPPPRVRASPEHEHETLDEGDGTLEAWDGRTSTAEDERAVATSAQPAGKRQGPLRGGETALVPKTVPASRPATDVSLGLGSRASKPRTCTSPEAVAPRQQEATTAALHPILATAGSSKAASVRTNTNHARGSDRQLAARAQPIITPQR